MKKAEDVFDSIKNEYRTYWDDRSNIGKRYKYQDEMGTPFCITIDYQTLEDNTVTIRERDSMKQDRISVDKVTSYLQEKLI
jgi:glycyl-tRNA synthetase